jgi:hypothetical protein
VTKGKGYLLPSGDATEDELECCLVFYPARDEYRRALMGSLDYLATWIAWERDTEKRGQDAAASWKLANIQTWECCNMGYCDDLLTTLEALLAATTALECCGDQDITDGKQYTDEIVDGVGDVPQNIIDAGYATDASDWTGFDSYKCMISHLAVDHVESFFRQIAPHISDTGIVIGGIGVVGALVGAILTVVGLPISAGIIIALGAAAAIWTWITSEGRDAVEDLADEIATNHDALACAIYQGDGVSDSVSDFNDEVDSLFTALNAIAIKAINLEPQLRAMYSGRYDQEDIAAKLEELDYQVSSYDCSECSEEEDWWDWYAKSWGEGSNHGSYAYQFDAWVDDYTHEVEQRYTGAGQGCIIMSHWMRVQFLMADDYTNPTGFVLPFDVQVDVDYIEEDTNCNDNNWVEITARTCGQVATPHACPDSSTTELFYTGDIGEEGMTFQESDVELTMYDPGSGWKYGTIFVKVRTNAQKAMTRISILPKPVEP